MQDSRPQQKKENMIGYTLSTVQKNKAANGRMVGVKIGRMCIKKNIPVKTLAGVAGVSTVTVYAWFAGEYSPRPDTATKLLAYVKAC
jgi:DNA-binding transcriptional regulator YiaG